MDAERTSETTTKPVEEDDDEDLEEGELSSSDDDDHNKGRAAPPSPPHLAEDYELIQRPVQARSKDERDLLIESRPIARPSRPPPTLGATTFKPLKDFDSDEEEETAVRRKQVLLQSSSDDDDSDEDLGSGKRRRFVPTHMGSAGGTKKAPWLVDSAAGTSAAGVNIEGDGANQEMMDHNDAFKSQAQAFQEKRKVNNIWGQLLQDEMVSDIFGKVGVQEASRKTVNVERGPESYSFQFKEDLKSRFGAVRSDSSDLSSAGLTDNELQVIKTLELASKKDKGVVEGELEEIDLRRKLDSSTRKRKYQPQKSRKRHLHHTKMKLFNRLIKMRPNVLAKYIAAKLDEPKQGLIERCIHIVSKKRCVSLFLKTMKILRRGGLLIKNQQRYRTPGGVFLYLLRGDPRIPYKLVNKVFEPEKTKSVQAKKKQQKIKRLKRKAKLEKINQGGENKPDHDADESSSISRSTSSMSSSADVNKMEESGTAESPGANSEADIDSDDYYGLRIDESEFAQEQPNQQPT